jgi:uncharacterized membrane protein YgdD (TMEM256/DUF423 family)
MNAVSIGAFLGALGVILGAFGTHAIKGKIGYDLYEIYLTGAQYLMLHAFAIVFYGLSKARAKWPLYCFFAGIFIFTGSLFCITFTGIRGFGAITPIGGVCLIAGWIGFGWEARKTT